MIACLNGESPSSSVVSARPSNLRAVVFDRDGVLTDFDLERAIAFFAPLLPLSLEEISTRWEAWGRQIGFPRTVSEERAFFDGFWELLSREFQLSSDVLKQLNAFDYTTCLRPFVDARPALRWAREVGLRVGVLSNFSLASLEDSLIAAGLADLVDVACAATVIGAAKPAPESYLTVTRALQVRPEQCLFFDDEFPCVSGASALGMSAYLVDRTQSEHRLSEGVVSDLSALAAICERI